MQCKVGSDQIAMELKAKNSRMNKGKRPKYVTNVEKVAMVSDAISKRLTTPKIQEIIKGIEE